MLRRRVLERAGAQYQELQERLTQTASAAAAEQIQNLTDQLEAKQSELAAVREGAQVRGHCRLHLFLVSPKHTPSCACGPAVQLPFSRSPEPHSILCMQSCCAVTLLQHRCAITAPPPAKPPHPSHLPPTILTSQCQTCICPVNRSLAHLSSGRLVTAMRFLRAGCQLLSACLYHTMQPPLVCAPCC